MSSGYAPLPLDNTSASATPLAGRRNHFSWCATKVLWATAAATYLQGSDETQLGRTLTRNLEPRDGEDPTLTFQSMICVVG